MSSLPWSRPQTLSDARGKSRCYGPSKPESIQQGSRSSVADVTSSSAGHEPGSPARMKWFRRRSSALSNYSSPTNPTLSSSDTLSTKYSDLFLRPVRSGVSTLDTTESVPCQNDDRGVPDSPRRFSRSFFPPFSEPSNPLSSTAKANSFVSKSKRGFFASIFKPFQRLKIPIPTHRFHLVRGPSTQEVIGCPEEWKEEGSESANSRMVSNYRKSESVIGLKGQAQIGDNKMHTWWNEHRDIVQSYLEEAELVIQSDGTFSALLTLFHSWCTSKIDTPPFVEELSRLLVSHPKLLENINPILKSMTPIPASIFVTVGPAEQVSLVTMLVFKPVYYGKIISLRTDTSAATFPCITCSDDLRRLLSSDDLSEYARALSSVGNLWAPAVIQLVQAEFENQQSDVLYSKKCQRLVYKLVKRYHSLPPSLLLETGVVRQGNNPVTGGGSADIWKGLLNGRVVCLKVLRYFLDENDRDRLFTSLRREALVWRRLDHPNIVPFFGINSTLFFPSFCMISPWMKNGQIMSYLKDHPEHNRHTVIREIAEGVNYLHSLDPPIGHGDIKGSNILVNDALVCCLTDFGLAAICESQPFTSSSMNTGGSMRWLPPEVFLPDEFPSYSRFARDIYSFGCTVLEIISGKEPFSEPRLVDAAVMSTVTRGGRPPRPIDNRWYTDELWELIEGCWAQDASTRPPAQWVLEQVRRI